VTRQQFDEWVPTHSPLRKLAGEIAGLNAVTWPAFLSRKGQEPLNVLANADRSDIWTPAPKFSRKEIVKWKGSPPSFFGFAKGTRASSRGLALLFDPFVDAFLAAHLKRGRELADCTVLVLTDYNPFVPIGYPEADWAECESRAILHGMVHSRHSTIVQLFDALFGRNAWCKQHEGIVEGIVNKKLLLWNFFPFFRGGVTPTGSSGLPRAGNWRLKCWSFLSDFLGAVGATRVILACSQAMLPTKERKGGPLTLSTLNIPGVKTPLPPLICTGEVFRVSHPSSWKRVQNHGPLLNSILTG